MSLDLSKMLDPFDPEQICSKCGHDEIETVYQPDSSHAECALGRRLGTRHAGEHLERRCRRCSYRWEQLVVERASDPVTVSA